jgi:hypothetical protein
MENKPKLVLIGASHIQRLEKAGRHVLKSQYHVILYAFPGARYERIIELVPWHELEQLTEHDTVLAQPFGNSMFKKGSHMITYNPKNIHLKVYARTEKESFRDMLIDFKTKCLNIKAKVIILDNIFKHVNCCKSHTYPGMISHQHQLNLMIRNVFQDSESIVLPWQKVYIPYLSKNKVKVSQLKNFFKDSVHLHESCYSRAVEKILGISTRRIIQ